MVVYMLVYLGTVADVFGWRLIPLNILSSLGTLGSNGIETASLFPWPLHINGGKRILSI